MKLGNSFVKGLEGDDSQVNINVAPLIDLLVIVVVFLVVTQTAVRFGIIDAGVVSSGGAGAAGAGATSIPVKLLSDHSIEVWIGQSPTIIPAKSGMWDLGEAKRSIASAPAPQRMEVQAAEGVSYGDLVSVMDSLKEVSPLVSLNIDTLQEAAP